VEEIFTLIADGAAGRLESIHLRFALAGDMAVRSLSILLFTGTVVESGMGIDPDLDARVSLKVDDRRRGRFGNSKGNESPLPRTNRGVPRSSRRRPQKGEHGDKQRNSEIKVGAVKTYGHTEAGETLHKGLVRGVGGDGFAAQIRGRIASSVGCGRVPREEIVECRWLAGGRVSGESVGGESVEARVVENGPTLAFAAFAFGYDLRIRGDCAADRNGAWQVGAGQIGCGMRCRAFSFKLREAVWKTLPIFLHAFIGFGRALRPQTLLLAHQPHRSPIVLQAFSRTKLFQAAGRAACVVWRLRCATMAANGGGVRCSARGWPRFRWWFR